MKKLLPLYYCKSKQEAIDLMNKIQQSIYIPIFVQRKYSGFMHVTDHYNYASAKTIIDHKLSVFIAKTIKVVKPSVKRESKKTPRFENLILDLFLQLNIM